MHSSKNWVLEIDSDVGKVLEYVPRRDAERILGAIKFLPADPYFGDIQKMKGEEDVWRRRIGSYRIFYKIKTAEKVVLVFRLERRTSKTY
jgi:mRNA interferase RelE/StbE